MKSSLTIWLFNFDYFPDVDGKKENDKNEDDGEKIGENEFNFWILHIKIRLYDNFHENQWEKCFRPYCRTFWLIEAKMKMKMKKYGKVSPIFEFSLSKMLCGNFHENPRKIFLTHRGKNKNEDEKIWKNEFDFWISISKLGCIDLFIKIWEKSIFFEIFNWERHTRTEVSKGFNTASIVSLGNNIMLK